MCRPDHFRVEYAINPWMDPQDPVDELQAAQQWHRLRDTYIELGHQVELIEPVPGLPDMVFTANGATIAAGAAMGVRFAFPQRQPEEQHFLRWLHHNGFPAAAMPTITNEGQGDLLPIGDRLLAGYGFRTVLAAHAEVAATLGVPVTSLRLVDPHYYHLDTALTVLGCDNVAYLPEAFAPESQRLLGRMFSDAVLATADDARVFGLNAICDGHNVIMTDEAPALAARYRALGYRPIELPFSQFRKSGGGIKCATLLLERIPPDLS
jgi:N-dimethylarginine dimethylaminohydrolase